MSSNVTKNLKQVPVCDGTSFHGNPGFNLHGKGARTQEGIQLNLANTMFAVVITKNGIENYGAVFHHGHRDHGFILERLSNTDSMILQTDNDNYRCYMDISYDVPVVYVVFECSVRA